MWPIGGVMKTTLEIEQWWEPGDLFENLVDFEFG